MRVMAVFYHNFNIFIPFHFFFFFTALCSMQDLSSLRDQTRAPWNGSVESFFFSFECGVFNCWTTKEVPHFIFSTMSVYHSVRERERGDNFI